MELSRVAEVAGKLIKVKYCGAVIVAAGNASRMGGIDKVMAPLMGEPMIVHTVRAFENADVIREIVVVTREDLVEVVTELTKPFSKVRAVVVGGKDIQDGARPLVSVQVIDRTVRAAHSYGAAAPAVPVKDTVKQVQGGVVRATPDRSALQAVQTPQVFDVDLLTGALYKAEQEKTVITDDCSAVENMGFTVKIVAGDECNMKVTTPMDLKIAQMLMEERK